MGVITALDYYVQGKKYDYSEETDLMLASKKSQVKVSIGNVPYVYLGNFTFL